MDRLSVKTGVVHLDLFCSMSFPGPFAFRLHYELLLTLHNDF